MLELVRRRQALQAAAFAVAPWLALLVTPYGPVATVRYYRLLLVDPPFADVVSSNGTAPGSPGRASRSGSCCIGAVILLLTGWRGFALTELVVLALTAAVALQAIRGIYWFSIACLIILPPAIDRAVGFREPPPLRKVGRVVSLLAVTGLLIAALAGGLTTGGRVADNWPASAAVPVRERSATLRRASTRPTATPTGCSGRFPSCGAASPTTCDSRSTRATRWWRHRPLQRRDGQGLEERRERLPHHRARQHRQDVASARLSGRAGNTGRLSRRRRHDRGSRITRLRVLHAAKMPANRPSNAADRSARRTSSTD